MQVIIFIIMKGPKKEMESFSEEILNNLINDPIRQILSRSLKNHGLLNHKYRNVNSDAIPRETISHILTYRNTFLFIHLILVYIDSSYYVCIN